MLVALVFGVLLSVVNSERIAVAHLKTDTIEGSVYFTETDDGGVRVTGSITGLPAGEYGFHVHELGNTITCDASGAHFNPEENTHGGRDHDVRHIGDLGNVVFAGTGNPVANIDFVDNLIALRGRNDILGRTLVLHEQADDLGLGGHETSLTTGNAGARVACAVIGIYASSEPWNSAASVNPSFALLTITLLSLLYKLFA